MSKIYPDTNLTGYYGEAMPGVLAAALEENYPMVIYEENPTIPGSGIMTSRITALVTGRDGSIFVHTRNSIYRLEILDTTNGGGE